MKPPAGALARRELLMARFELARTIAERENLAENGAGEERNGALIVVYYISRTRLGRDRSRHDARVSAHNNIVYTLTLGLMTLRVEAGKTAGGSRTGY